MRNEGTTSKGRETRERIVRAAGELFAERGYAATTMRDVAERADCALGLTYRYFARREDLVLALYSSLADEFAGSVAKLREGTVAQRFRRAMEKKLELLDANREALLALVAAAITPTSEVAVGSHASAPVRRKGHAIFRQVIAGASDAPSDPDSLAATLYALHLLIVLAWTQDRSRQARHTRHLLREIEAALAFFAPFVASVPGRALVTRAERALAPFFESPIAEALS